MNRTRRNHGQRRGLTLVELLVTVTILLMITAIAIPVLAPSGDERRMRETSRLVTSFLQGARTRAIQTGRQFGVMIEQLDGNPAAAVQLSYAEVQEPYAGDFLDSRVHIVAAQLTTTDQVRGGVGLFVNASGTAVTNSGWIGLVRPGDLIKLGYQGHYYSIQPGEPFLDGNGDGVWNSPELYVDLNRDGSYTTPASCVDATTGYLSSLPWTLTPVTAPLSYSSNWVDLDSDGVYDSGEGDGVPFQIYRQPVKTAAAPLTLPEGMVIDLSGSSVGSGLFGPEPLADANNNGVWNAPEVFTDTNGDGVWSIGNRGPFIILFSPGGSVSSIFFRSSPSSLLLNDGAPTSAAPGTPVHLLIGKIEQTLTTPGQENWRDLTNLWISIHPQTGLVTATEIGGDANNNGVISRAESLFYAERGQSIGGR